jgi:hypothetical protein
LIPSFGKMFCSPPYPKCVENKVKPHYFFKRKLNTLVSTYELHPHKSGEVLTLRM